MTRFATILVHTLVEVAEHVIAGGLRGNLVRLVLRVHVETVAEEVEVEVAQVRLALFLVTARLQLLFIKAL